MNLKRGLGIAALAAAVLWAWNGLAFQDIRYQSVARGVTWFWDQAWPLDWSVLPSVGTGLVSTLQIALLATLLGFIMSLPVAVLATRTVFPTAVVVPARVVASAVRVLPSLLWAIFAVIVLGFGPLAGVVALAFYSMGYLAKLQYEAFEGQQRDALEAVRAMGAGRFQQAWHVVLPEAANALRSQLLFMFEYNVRSASIIGLVGAGGIGQLLATYLKFFRYDRVLVILLVLFATVLVLDGISFLVRRRYLEVPESRARPRWRDALFGPRRS